jgi:hypothetical protein
MAYRTNFGASPGDADSFKVTVDAGRVAFLHLKVVFLTAATAKNLDIGVPLRCRRASPGSEPAPAQ